MNRPSTVSLTSTKGALATIAAHGAHVLSWTLANGDERLFLSNRSAYGAGVAIRGGVPVIFPQFAAFGPLPKHGFARTREWRVAKVDRSGAAFVLQDDDETRAIWPHRFMATIGVRLDDASLAVTLTVENRDDAPFEFTTALHTYLRVDDIAKVAVRGLERRAYRDSAAGGAQRDQPDGPLHIVGEVDRIYVDVPNAVEVRDESRATRVVSEGFRDVVIWNPGDALAAKLADLEPDGWRRMLCVESAVIETPVRLEPGKSWRGTQRLAAIG